MVSIPQGLGFKSRNTQFITFCYGCVSVKARRSRASRFFLLLQPLSSILPCCSSFSSSTLLHLGTVIGLLHCCTWAPSSGCCTAGTPVVPQDGDDLWLAATTDSRSSPRTLNGAETGSRWRPESGNFGEPAREERTHTTTTHTLPMARASAGARGLTTEEGAKSTQTSSSAGERREAGSKGVWL